MNKRIISSNIFINPMPVVIIGSRNGNNDNFMTCSLIGRVNTAPPILSVSLNKDHETTENITETGFFSINIPTSDLLEKTDFCGTVSNGTHDKSKLFDIFNSDSGKTPMIRSCPVNIECKVIDSKTFPSNKVFYAEIVNVLASESFLKDDAIDFEKMDNILITMPDNIYWNKGKKLGTAWNNENMKKFS